MAPRVQQPNGSRLSCGRPTCRRKGVGRQAAPARAQHSPSLKTITARQLQALVRRQAGHRIVTLSPANVIHRGLVRSAGSARLVPRTSTRGVAKRWPFTRMSQPAAVRTLSGQLRDSCGSSALQTFPPRPSSRPRMRDSRTGTFLLPLTVFRRLPRHQPGP